MYEVAILIGALIIKSKTEAVLGGILPVGQLMGELTAASCSKCSF